MTIKNDMDRLQYRKGGLLKLLLKKGDTLFSIARENDLSVAELLEVSHLYYTVAYPYHF